MAKFKLIPRLKFMRYSDLAGEARSYIKVKTKGLPGEEVGGAHVKIGEKSLDVAVKDLIENFKRKVNFSIVFPPELMWLIYQEHGTATHIGGERYRIPNPGGKTLQWPDPHFLYLQYHHLASYSQDSPLYGEVKDDKYYEYATTDYVMHPGVPPTRWLTDVLDKIGEISADFFKNVVTGNKGKIPSKSKLIGIIEKDLFPKIKAIMAESITRKIDMHSRIARSGGEVNPLEGTKLQAKTPSQVFLEYVQYRID